MLDFILWYVELAIWGLVESIVVYCQTLFVWSWVENKSWEWPLGASLASKLQQQFPEAILRTLWERTPVSQTASKANLCTRYPAAAVTTGTSAPPSPRGAITGAVAPTASRGVTIWALDLPEAGREISGGSVLLPPKGAFNGAAATNYTNGRKRDFLKHRQDLYWLEEEMSRQQGKIHSTL